MHCSAAGWAPQPSSPGGITGYYRDTSKKLLGGFSPLEYPPSRQDSSAVGPGLLRHKQGGSRRRRKQEGFLQGPFLVVSWFLKEFGVWVSVGASLNVGCRNCSCCLLLHMNFFPCVPSEAPELKALLPLPACSDGWI